MGAMADACGRGADWVGGHVGIDPGRWAALTIAPMSATSSSDRRTLQWAMTKRQVIGCAICKGSPVPGWVCEDHPDKPWEHDGCGGAGGALRRQPGQLGRVEGGRCRGVARGG